MCSVYTNVNREGMSVPRGGCVCYSCEFDHQMSACSYLMSEHEIHHKISSKLKFLSYLYHNQADLFYKQYA